MNACHSRVMPLALLAVLACDDAPTPPQPSFFTASLRGAVETEFDGTGTFSLGTLPWGGKTFQIYAEAADGPAMQTFVMRRYDGPPLPRGTYPLTLVHGISETSQGQGAVYKRRGEVEEAFAADAGELVITASTSEIMAGSFTFEGFRYCVRDPETYETIQGPCRIPDWTLEWAPRIAVTGSFVVTRKNNVLIPD